jgi:hypothetical protein
MVFHFVLVTFVAMNKKRVLISLFFGLAVLIAIVLQSVHTFNHLEQELTTKECHHKYAKNKTEFTHAHHNLDHCFVCEFTFSTSIKSDFYTFTFKKVEIPVSYSYFYSKEITQSFRGSLFALRAPPSFIV